MHDRSRNRDPRTLVVGEVIPIITHLDGRVWRKKVKYPKGGGIILGGGHDVKKAVFSIGWASHRGFGQYTFIWTDDGKLVIDTECDTKESVKEVLCAMVDAAEERK